MIAFAFLVALIAAYRHSPRTALRLALTIGASVVVSLGLLWPIAGPT